MTPQTSDSQTVNSVADGLNIGGRPTKYERRFNRLAFKFSLLGATDRQIADFLEVSEVTLNAWKKEYPSFLKSLQRGKLQADANVAKSLYHRALGYSHEAVKIFSFEGQTFEHKYTEHYPPDTAAAFIWLKNRRPEAWRDRMETTNIHKLDWKSLPPEALQRLTEQLLRDAMGTDDPAALAGAHKQLEAACDPTVVETTAEVVEDKGDAGASTIDSTKESE